MKAGQPTCLYYVVLIIHPVMSAKAGKKSHLYAFSEVCCDSGGLPLPLLFYLQDINK